MSDYTTQLPPSRSGSATFMRNPKMQHLGVPARPQVKSNRNSPYSTPVGSPNRQRINSMSNINGMNSMNNVNNANNTSSTINKSPDKAKSPRQSHPSASNSFSNKETITIIPENPEPERKRTFKKEITQMMAAFGERNAPYEDSVNLMSDIMENFIADMARQAVCVGKPGKLNIEDILYLIRYDQKKNSRACELLKVNEKIKKARTVDEVTEMAESEGKHK